MPAQPLKFLVVEDHADTADVLARLLRLNGHTVCCASDCKAALDAAAGEVFDVVLFDIMLPDGNGADLLMQLRARGSVHAIAMTAAPEMARADHVQRAAFDAILIKPIKYADLLSAVKLIIEPARAADVDPALMTS